MSAPIPELMQDLLDRGIDPLDDPRARDWLLDHPDALESFAGLRAGLAGMQQASAPARRAPLLRLLLPAAGLAGGLLWWALAGAGAPKRLTTGPLPRPDFAESARVVGLTAVTTVEGSTLGGSGDSYRAVVTAGNFAGFRLARFVAHTRPSPHVPLCTTALSAEENVLQ